MARLVRSFCCERLIVKRGLYKKENSVTIQFNGSKFNVIQKMKTQSHSLIEHHLAHLSGERAKVMYLNRESRVAA